MIHVSIGSRRKSWSSILLTRNIGTFVSTVRNRCLAMNDWFVGFTGTRTPTPDQLARLDFWFKYEYEPGNALRHGDCIGADAEAFRVAKRYGWYTIAHPPINPKQRAFTKSDLILPEKDYHDRNHDIVEMCSGELIALVPGPEKDFPRSGTWATVRHAKRMHLPQILLCWPNGVWSIAEGYERMGWTEWVPKS